MIKARDLHNYVAKIRARLLAQHEMSETNLLLSAKLESAPGNETNFRGQIRSSTAYLQKRAIHSTHVAATHVPK